MERLETEPLFELSFYYKTVKKQGPVFTIFALRTDSHEEQYSINLEGEDKIVSIMGQFSNDFNMIVSHLRVMNEALVLLNPKKSVQQSPKKTEFMSEVPQTQQDGEDTQVPSSQVRTNQEIRVHIQNERTRNDTEGYVSKETEERSVPIHDETLETTKP